MEKEHPENKLWRREVGTSWNHLEASFTSIGWGRADHPVLRGKSKMKTCAPSNDGGIEVEYSFVPKRRFNQEAYVFMSGKGKLSKP